MVDLRDFKIPEGDTSNWVAVRHAEIDALQDINETVEQSLEETVTTSLGKIVGISNNEALAVRPTLKDVLPPLDVDGDDLIINHGQSIVNSGGSLMLSNDETSPGNNKFYSTDGSGTKGWHLLSGNSYALYTASFIIYNSTSGSNINWDTIQERTNEFSSMAGGTTLTIPADGRYVIKAQMTVNSGSSSDTDMEIRINGSVPVGAGSARNGRVDDTLFVASHPLSLTSGDLVSIYIESGSGLQSADTTKTWVSLTKM